MHVHAIAVVTFGFALSAAAQPPSCPKGLQPFGGRCVSQAMADYIACVEASGGNRSEIVEELKTSRTQQGSGTASGSASNKLVAGSAGLALDKKAETDFASRIEKRWFQGSMSECAKILKSSTSTAPAPRDSRAELSTLLADRQRHAERLFVELESSADPLQRVALRSFRQRYSELVKAAQQSLSRGELVRYHELIRTAASNLKCNTHQRKVCTWIRRRSTASFSPKTG
jgi:hypothetical protein